MKIKNTKLRATTLVELLVVMIIMGIIILALFNGVLLFKKFSLNITQGYSKVHDELLNYEKVENLFFESDSIILDNQIYTFYCKGEPLAFRIDSLFSNPIAIHNIWCAYNPNLIDSIVVSYLKNNDTIRLKFGIEHKPDIIYQKYEIKR